MTNATIVARVDSGDRIDLTLPAGTYYVGDPCYAVAPELYDWLSKEIFPPRGSGYDIFDVHVRVTLPDGSTAELFDMRTKYGDGRYPFGGPAVVEEPRGRSGLGVDSGGMAVIDSRLVDKEWAWTVGGKVAAVHPLAITAENGDLTAANAFSVLTEDAKDE